MEQQISKLIDHTALKADTTKAVIEKLCNEAKQFEFMSVCVNPTWIEFAADMLKGTDVKVCTVIGFPLGANTPEVKGFETSDAIAKGATEVDMVLNIGAMKDGNYALVERDVRAVVEAAKGKALSKVILETCLLTKEEIKKACEICEAAGADFVKTSTGFSTGGATVEDVKLMSETVSEHIGVKASGGVRNLDDLMDMVEAGATRIGTSGGVAIVQGENAKSGY